MNGFQTSQTITYFVKYRFSGFLPPILSPLAINSVRAGSSIPIRFTLGGNQGLDIFASGFPKSREIAARRARATVAPRPRRQEAAR